jgi:hypothetical protein
MGRSLCNCEVLQRSTNSNEDGSPEQASLDQRKQEMYMEQLARKGADRIASLSVSERTKRAMLAEKIEDSIFENAEKLESLVDSSGALPPENREQALELAQETRAFQVQYEELVSGKPSSVLNSLEQVMQDNRRNKD